MLYQIQSLSNLSTDYVQRSKPHDNVDKLVHSALGCLILYISNHPSWWKEATSLIFITATMSFCPQLCGIFTPARGHSIKRYMIHKHKTYFLACVTRLAETSLEEAIWAKNTFA